MLRASETFAQGDQERSCPSARRTGRPARNLRFRWHRAFAVLVAVVLLTAITSVAGIRLTGDGYRSSAVGLDKEATASAQLRTEIVAAAILAASTITPTQQSDLAGSVAAIRKGYAADLASLRSVSARTILSRSQATWETVLKTVGFPGQPADLVARADAVTAHVSTVLSLLDQADSKNRVAVSDDLAAAARHDRAVLVGLVLLELIAVVLAIRLSLQLSTEILLPVTQLRDSANELAAGNLDRRVVVERPDELGELAISFNAMADSIADSQRTLSHEAATDALSGLENRSAFYARLSSALETSRGENGLQVLLFVDLDDFKDVNDALGHAAGDEVLRVVSSRLVKTLRESEHVARLGGDEFALLLNVMPDAVAAVATSLVASLGVAVSVGACEVHISASVGLALRQEASTLEGWVREADVAMYTSKARGKNRFEQYDARLDEATVAQQRLKDEVAGAAERGELVLDYQPIVGLRTGELVAMEALVRWQHPTLGLLPPSAFIQLAEESGAIIDIGTWVLKKATHDLRGWQRRYGRPDLWMSVNVSVRQLEAPLYAQTIESIIEAAKISPGTLVIEVTESVLADPHGGAAATLTALRLNGTRVALDDFGTGYSSIGYLRQLPVDFLKIDRSFVAGAGPNAPCNALLEAIVGMARHLDLDIIPEGIEQPTELGQLRAMGCEIGQGFLMSRPVAPEIIDALLAEAIPFPHVAFNASCAEIAPFVNKARTSRSIPNRSADRRTRQY
jgi:diguanylate cyclase (GGDEF)-like protein